MVNDADRDERLVEFVRHFHACEAIAIGTGQLLFELATAVLQGDARAPELAAEALRFIEDHETHDGDSEDAAVPLPREF